MNKALVPPEHLIKGKRNREFASWVRGAKPEGVDWSATDWSVTAYFYSALHYVDAYLHKRNTICEGHKARGKAVQMIFPLEYEVHYRSLRNISELARYDSVEIKESELGDAVALDYEPLIRWLKSQLGIA